ncbi:hypothetical protein [Fredinandcohnia onubensis]|uniref:hypothetical protein n=1 Tax=Fredinandcohnia onubensis TaxID=1571209 RepID=UPI000C0C0E55|nr:hypothetical protein [Fredinandcohnia onubensis]
MRNKALGMFVLAIVYTLLLVGCTPNKTPLLKGSYQSEHVNGYIVQMTFQPEDHSFVEYIDNREVDKGTYEELEDGLYKINGELQEFEITLNNDNSFDVVVKKINDVKPITLKNVDDTPVYIGTEFDDVDEYKSLLE